MIQSLLNSGGQAKTMQRYAQVRNYIDGVSAKADLLTRYYNQQQKHNLERF